MYGSRMGNGTAAGDDLGLEDLIGTGHNVYCVAAAYHSHWENLALDYPTIQAITAAERTDEFFQEIERRTREGIHELCRCDEAFTPAERTVR